MGDGDKNVKTIIRSVLITTMDLKLAMNYGLGTKEWKKCGGWDRCVCKLNCGVLAVGQMCL
jgi:hypothetical protein